jgi:Histidinol phosphatase and related hydrolases of the PHP family
MYKIIADLHTHSIASDHAYNTIKEMADTAKEKGLFALAVTDHDSLLMPGAPTDWYFRSMSTSVPYYYRDVLILCGAETDVMNFDGTVHLEEDVAKSLDWVVASIHNLGYEGLQNPTPEKCTEMWLKVSENPYVNVIGHSGDPDYAYDYEKVVPAFGANGKLVEINAHTFDVRAKNIPNCRKIAEICKKYGVQIVVNSDAHFETEIANFENVLHMLEEIDFPEELIVNSSEERLMKYIEEHTHMLNRERRKER